MNNYKSKTKKSGMHQNKKLIHTGSHNLKEYFTKHKKDKIK